MYDFEWFNPTLGTPIVSIGEFGLGFNRASIDAIKCPARVRLGYDRANKVIGVQPADEDDSLALVFANKERNNYVRVSSKDFVRFVLRHHPELRLDKTVRCLAWLDSNLGLLVVDLKQSIDQENEEQGDE